jgi:hypothetical protein
MIWRPQNLTEKEAVMANLKITDDFLTEVALEKTGNKYIAQAYATP